MIKVLFFMAICTISSFAADAENGGKLYKKCIACHGADGMGKKSQKAPMVAGQFDWYIQEQIVNIKSGKRANNNSKKMMPYVKNLSESDIADLSLYISQLPLRK